jgi:TonB family protein
MKIASLTAVLALACALASQAFAQGSDNDGSYPDGALKQCLSGQVTVRCVVTPGGELSGCTILSETPPGEGFGDATLDAAAQWRIRPVAADGTPTSGGVFQRTIVWKPPPDCVPQQ